MSIDHGNRQRRGLISGHWKQERALAKGDFRGSSPRFPGDNLTHNLAQVDTLRDITEAKGVTVAHMDNEKRGHA